MNWYLSKLVYRIICGQGQHTPQFDEQLRLIAAGSSGEAYEKAVALGNREEDRFLNHDDKVVQWKFINVAELHDLGALKDGAELYSRIEETDNAESYIELTNRKAAHLQRGADVQHYLEIL